MAYEISRVKGERDAKEYLPELYRSKTGKTEMTSNRLIKEMFDVNIFVSDGRVGLNADAIEIVSDISSEVELCSSCFKARLFSVKEQVLCVSCESSSFTNSDSNEFTKRYKK